MVFLSDHIYWVSIYGKEAGPYAMTGKTLVSSGKNIENFTLVQTFFLKPVRVKCLLQYL